MRECYDKRCKQYGSLAMSGANGPPTVNGIHPFPILQMLDKVRSLAPMSCARFLTNQGRCVLYG